MRASHQKQPKSGGSRESRTDQIAVLILMGHFANVGQIGLFKGDGHCNDGVRLIRMDHA